jgi:RNA polymerase sigma-70 factor (sigma-E family)
VGGEGAVVEPDGFREFVVARSAALVRSAVLLTGDEALAQDLVQAALAKTWSRWARVVRQDAPEAYVRAVMVSTFLTWNRRRWRAEQPVAEVPERDSPRDDFAAADLRSCVLGAVRGLAPRQRAVVVLRYFDDLTEPQVAAVLGCSVGTVKSQSAKALLALRACPQLQGLADDEVTHDAR